MTDEGLQEWRDLELIDALDEYLANLLERLHPGAAEMAKLAVVLASQAARRGHACLDLREPAWPWDADVPGGLPGAERVLAAARSAPFVGRPGDSSPLILDAEDRLYLHRYWRYEHRLAKALAQRRDGVPHLAEAREVDARLARLFGHFTREDVVRDEQAQAVRLALGQSVFLLTGGPGTGKTTTVARLLALLLEFDPKLRVALAAPTGKAALRLQESISAQRESLAVEPEIAALIPASASTLHRLLGHQTGKADFRHHAENPLPYDLVVVDEASMIDLPIAAKLLDALAPNARLVLVGDREQLPSVEVGSVFADLCAAECRLPQAALTQNHRFQRASGIGALAEAARTGDFGKLANVLGGDASGQVSRSDLPNAGRIREEIGARLEPLLRALHEFVEPDVVFGALERDRLLCALRRGPLGSEALNRGVKELLAARGWVEARARWHSGQPIMITENDYMTGLFNGDTGVILPWERRLQAFFPGQRKGEYRRFPLDRLPAHELAYALTVHKSQGSEFDRVTLVLPSADSPVLTRELLYTGVTRARTRVEILGAMSLLAAALARPLRRMTGLRRQLAEA